MKQIILLLTAVLPGSAQMISFGVKGGAVLTDPSSTNQSFFSSSTSGVWTGGPTVEFHLPYRFSVEIDALFHGSRQTTSLPFSVPTSVNGDSIPALFSSQTRTKSWEFPILLKYRFSNGPVRPFVSAGISITHDSSHGQSLWNCLGSLAACNQAVSNSFLRGGSFDSTNNRKGPTAGAGIDFKRRYVTISPEVRYTHLDQPRGNKVAALVGFTFGK